MTKTTTNRGHVSSVARWIRDHLDAEVTTRVKHLLVAVVILSVCFGLVLHQQSTRDAIDRHRDRVANVRASYDASLRAYDAELAGYNTCVTSVGIRSDLRTVLLAIVDISDVLPDAPRAEAYTAARQKLIDARYPAQTVEVKCHEAPVPPPLPQELTP